MLDAAKAAEYFIVAWCKDWSMRTYLSAVLERPCPSDLAVDLDAIVEQFPWLPSFCKPYGYSVREYVGGSFPRLNRWLWSRADDVARLKVADQVLRLKAPRWLEGFVRPEERAEMKRSSRDMGAATTSYRQSREAFKTHQRSAWNVCK